MKQLIKHIFILALFMRADVGNAQYVVRDSSGVKIFNGLLQKSDLSQEASFAWMRNNISWYKPNADAVKHLTRLKGKIHLIAFIGTWCEDSQIVLPQLFKLMEAASFPETSLSIIGVERNKKTLSQLSEALNIDKVPTILVMQQGKEVGRIIEYGKYGVYDQELAEILATAKE